MKRLNSNQGKHWLWAVLFMIGISGCTDDSLREEAGKDNGPASGKTGYIVLDIAADSGGATTRAWGDGQAGEAGDDEFNEGDPGEQAMASEKGSHWVILFNEDGSFHSMEELEIGKKPKDDTETHPGHEKETVISRFVGQFVKGEEDILPKKLLVVLNADPKLMTEVQGKFTEGKEKAEDIILSYLTDKMTNKDFKEGKWPAIFYTPDGTNYCTMSNTTYADSLNKDVITLQDIPEEAIQDTEEQAAEHPIRVHVERLAVKVELAVKDVEVSDKPVVIEPEEKEGKEELKKKEDEDDKDDEAESVKWSVLIRGWSTSGIARRMYLFKNLDDGKSDPGSTGLAQNPHYNNGSITTPFFDFWNAWERFRCYWAVDDSYHDPSVYPTQYREAEDGDEITTKPYEGWYDKDDLNNNESPLYYYSYNEITNLSEGKTPEGKDKDLMGNLLSSKVHRYCPENTLGEELLEGKTYRSASTHVIITAQLLFDEEDKAEEAIEDAKKVSDKYHADGFWWDREGYIRHAYNKLFKALKAGKSFKDIFGDDKDKEIKVPKKVKIYAVKDDKETELTVDSLGNMTEEEFPFTLDEARIVGGDGRQMLALKDGWTLKLKSGKEGESEEVEIDKETFLSMVYAFVGYTDLFKQGMMYYWIPIRHVQGGDRSQGWQLGDIGIVRNHWYKFNITSVIRPGIPVDDPDDPLIPDEPHDPPEEPTEAYLGLEVRILPWHIIEQNVELGEDLRK